MFSRILISFLAVTAFVFGGSVLAYAWIWALDNWGWFETGKLSMADPWFGTGMNLEDIKKKIDEARILDIMLALVSYPVEKAK